MTDPIDVLLAVTRKIRACLSCDQWQHIRVQKRKLPNTCMALFRQCCFCPPLPSVFSSWWFSAVRNYVSNLVGSNHKRGLSQSSTSDSFTTVRTLHVLLLRNVTVCRRSSVRLHVPVEHPHQDIHLRHPWWPDCAEDVKVSIVQEQNLHVESFHWRRSSILTENHVHRFSA